MRVNYIQLYSKGIVIKFENMIFCVQKLYHTVSLDFSKTNKITIKCKSNCSSDVSMTFQILFLKTELKNNYR